MNFTTIESIKTELIRIREEQELNSKKIEELEDKLEQLQRGSEDNLPIDIIHIGETYYFKNSMGVTSAVNENSRLDRIRDKKFILYRSREDAEEWEKAFELQKQLRDICDMYPIDWNNVSTKKCYLFYGIESGVADIGYSYTLKHQNTYYCSDKTALEKFIHDVGQNDIIKYIFEVGMPKRCHLEVK